MLTILGAILLLAKPAEVPPLFFDEGWNLIVARNWIELGHFGPLINGLPVAVPTISTGFPAIIPLALSFRAFGIGVWQARLPGIFFTAGAVSLICYIAYRLFGQKGALGTLAVLMLMSIHPELHPVLVGRQALGEMPAIFFLLAGYTCFLAGQRGKAWFKSLTVFWWGLALMTKTQVLPFLLLALLVPLLMVVLKHKWRLAGVILGGLLGSVMVLGALILCQKLLMHDPFVPHMHIASWYRTTAVVPVASVRIAVLSWTFMFGLPTSIGILHASVELMRRRGEERFNTEAGLVQVSLLVLSGGWLVWYVFLSIGFLRYLFPAVFLGSVFTSFMLYSLTNGFRPPQLRFNCHAAGTMLALALIAWATPVTAYGLYQSYKSDAGKSLLRVATYINTRSQPDAVIETGEAELFFLLNRRYSYGLKSFPISLSMEFNPDYLVIGPMVRNTGGDCGVLKGNEFIHVATFDRYDIYRRNR